MTRWPTESLNPLNAQLFVYGLQPTVKAAFRTFSSTLNSQPSTLNSYCTFHLSNQVSLSERPIHKRR